MLEFFVPQWQESGAVLRFVLFTGVIQFIVFTGIWRALCVERARALRIHRRAGTFKPLRKIALRLAMPYGGVFLTIGIAGTFIGLAYNVDSMDEYVRAVQTASANPNSGLEADRDRALDTVLGGVYISLCSTIAGIGLYFVARIFWPPCELESFSYDDLEAQMKRCETKLSQGTTRSTQAAGLYIDTVRVLLKEARNRSHLAHDGFAEIAGSCAALAKNAIDNNGQKLAKYASDHRQPELDPHVLRKQLGRLNKEIQETAF